MNRLRSSRSTAIRTPGGRNLKLKAGKLPLGVLSRLLSKVELSDPRVALGPKAGEDAALIDFGDRYLVAKTDPITFATDLIGWYVVQINANDLAVMGAAPRWLMVTLLLPEGVSAAAVERIFDQIGAACKELGVTLVGGHTEVTYGLPRPIAVGAMLGEAAKDQVVTTSGARPGDAIVLTKGVAIEGAAVLAREDPETLLARGVRNEDVERAKGFLFSPGISVLRDANTARGAVDVHAMHDPTEGGVATGLLEMAEAAGVGLLVDLTAVPVLPECRRLCEALDLDPMGLIASGSLLAAVPPGDVPVLIEELAKVGIPAYEIGRFTRRAEGVKAITNDGARGLPVFPRDELARHFSD